MIIRESSKEDIDVIRELNNRQDGFRLYDFNGAITDRIAIDGDRAIAYAILKRIGEAIILMDPSAPEITRKRVLIELMKYAEFYASKDGCCQLLTQTDNMALAESLIKHFGFVETNGILLVKNL